MIDHCVVFFPCRDIEETTAFYHDILGFPIISIQAEGKLKIFDTGGGCWGFSMRDDFDPSAVKGLCLSLECESIEDVDRYYDKLKNTSVTITKAPHHNSIYPVYSFFMEDPSGYTVEIQKMTDR